MSVQFTAGRGKDAGVVLLFGFGATALLCLTQPMSLVDDAFISYRYVTNLLHDHQLVFNLGERVEGATNLLWMLVLAAATAATHVRTEVLALVLSVLLFGVTVAWTAAVASHLGGSLASGMLATAAVFLNADVFLTATNGLEASLYMAVLAQTFAALVLSRSLALGLGLGLLFMTRPDGAGVGLILLAAHLCRQRNLSAAALVAVPWLAIAAAVTLFRFAYFGALIPNSVIAKSFPMGVLPEVLAEQSWPYLHSFWQTDPVLTLIFGSLVLVSLATLRRRPADAMPVLALTCATVIVLYSYAVAARNGGDWMEHSRLLTQYAPAYALGLAALCGLVRSATPVLGVATAVSLLTLPVQGCCTIAARLVPPSDFFAEVATRLAPLVRPDDVVSAEAAGLLPYRLISTQIHDPIGLMDPYIARHGTPSIPYGKTDIDYTFGTVRPSFMAWHWAGHVRAARADLRAAYRGFCYRLCDKGDLAMVVLVRSDRMDEAVDHAFSDWTPWPLP